MGGQSFNFAFKFPIIGAFQPRILHFRTKFLDNKKTKWCFLYSLIMHGAIVFSSLAIMERYLISI